MRIARMAAGDEGVELFNPVHESVFRQERQRAIDHGRLRPETFGPQDVEDLVRAHAAMLLQQDFEHPAPHRRQLQSVAYAVILGRGDGFADAGAVIVVRKPDRSHPTPFPEFGLDRTNAITYQAGHVIP